jgi:hypothetical protein
VAWRIKDDEWLGGSSLAWLNSARAKRLEAWGHKTGGGRMWVTQVFYMLCTKTNYAALEKLRLAKSTFTHFPNPNPIARSSACSSSKDGNPQSFFCHPPSKTLFL